MKKFMLFLLISSLILSFYPCSVMAQGLTFADISIESIDEPITKNLSLSQEINGVNYTWSTSNSNVITVDGIVKRPPLGQSNATVTITAAGGGTTTEFIVTVKAFQSAEEVISKTKNELKFNVLSSENINEVTEDLYLPAKWDNGANIYWESSNENLIAVSGKKGIVKRPPFGEGIACTILTAHISLDGETSSKSFLVRVKEQEIGRNYSQALKKMMEDFDKEFTGAQNLLAIRSDLVIPNIQSDKIDVSFLSMNPETLSDDGKITRSVYTDNIVSFVVSLTYGYEETHLSYSMIVKAVNDDELTGKLEEDVAWVIAQLNEKHDLTRLAENLSLPQSGPNGSALSYISNNTLALTNGGEIKQSQSQQSAIFTISASMNQKTVSQSVNITIPKQNRYQDEGSLDYSGGSLTGGGSVISGGTGEVTLETDIEKLNIPFNDVSESHWAAESIYGLRDKGVVSGSGNGYFYPDSYLTREELVKMVVLATNQMCDGEIPFYDIHPTHWSYPYVVSAYTKGIINGKSKEYFGRGENVTRQDAAVIIYNTLKEVGFDFDNLDSGAMFSDYNSVSIYARIAVSQMQKAGLINGRNNNQFSPLENLKRSEAAAMIWRMTKL